MTQISFGDKLREIRKRHGFSQRQLGIRYGRLQGKEDGASPSIIAQWESNVRKPTRESVGLVAQALRATSDEHDELLLAAGFTPEHRSISDVTKDSITIEFNGAGELSDLGRQFVRDFAKEILERERKTKKEQKSGN